MSSLRSAALGSLRRMNAALPEGAWKNRLRAASLGLRNSLPRELMVSAGETAVQVGMWRSSHLLRLLRCVGPRGRVVLVEADERNVECLRDFVERCSLTNVSLVAKGAFHEPGRKTLHVGTSPAFSRLEADVTMISDFTGEAFSGTREIEVDTIDHILGDLGVERADYVEITVNGMELEVLQGMEATLQTTRRLFLSGYARTSREAPTNQRTREFLDQRGFRTKVSRRVRARRVFDHEEAGQRWGDMEGHVFAWRE